MASYFSYSISHNPQFIMGMVTVLMQDAGVCILLPFATSTQCFIWRAILPFIFAALCCGLH